MTDDTVKTAYFEQKVLRDRSYVTIALCQAVLAAPLRRERQSDGRWRA